MATGVLIFGVPPRFAGSDLTPVVLADGNFGYGTIYSFGDGDNGVFFSLLLGKDEARIAGSLG